jgi:hypothetical protein
MAFQFDTPADYEKLELSGPFITVAEIPEEQVFESAGTTNIKKIVSRLGFEHDKEGKIFKMKTSFKCYRIPKGTRVHRADHAGAQTPNNAMPAFFGNMESVGLYSRGNPGAFTHYTFSKDCEIVILDFEFLKKMKYHPAMEEEDFEVLGAYFDSDEGYVRPIGFMPENLVAYTRSNKKYPPKYLNRRMAELVCKLGFPGWMVLPFNVPKRQGLIQIHPRLQERLAYAPEIMLCTWTDYLVPDGSSVNGGPTSNSSSRMNEVDGGAYKRKRKTRRSNKKKRQQ